MIRVKRYKGEDFEDMLHRFKTACRREGVISGVRSRRAYEKPSERRRRKRYEAARISRKAYAYKKYQR